MSLYAWKRDIEADVGIVMRWQGCPDLSRAARRAWVRAFVAGIVAGWRPGMPLLGQQATLVGAAFEEALAIAQGGFPGDDG